jgi:hypothetical protein
LLTRGRRRPLSRVNLLRQFYGKTDLFIAMPVRSDIERVSHERTDSRRHNERQPMNTRTKWTDKRLQRLFDHYNKTYWRGKLPQYPVRVRMLKHRLGTWDPKNREILIDIYEHRNDRGIRATLLHEMIHITAGLGHGYKFWAQMEQLLRQGAPIEVGTSEAPGLRILADVVPRKFALARKAMEKVEASRQRPILRAMRNRPMRNRPVIQLTEDDIQDDFKEAAWEMTERPAVVNVGVKHGLLDVEGKPKSKWAAGVIARGRKAFRVERREFLQMEKFKAQFQKLPANKPVAD